MNANIMDTWLVANSDAVRINLGESNVADLRFGDVFPEVDRRREIDALTLGNNDTWGSVRLRQRIADTYPGIGPTDVLVTAGVSEAIVAVTLAHYEPGANFIIPTPAFHALIDVPKKLGYEIRALALSSEQNFRLDPDTIMAAIDGRTRIILLNSPHNPTGRVYSYGDIVRIADAANRVGATVVVDEHYRYLPHDISSPWIQSVAGARDNIVTLGSVGKCFGCTGIRVGWIAASPRLLEMYHEHKLLITHTIPVISDYIASELLTRRDAILPKVKDTILRNLDRLQMTVSRSDGAMILCRPDAGSVAFVRLRGIQDTFAFAQALLKESGVLVLPGESFELPGFLRIRLGISPSDFDHACKAIAAFVQSLSGVAQDLVT